MSDKQHTLKQEISISGVGLHTGKSVNMTFKPAPINHGFKFKRVDLEGQPIVDADVDNVVDTSRGTSIEQNGARINTVEHTLAALAGLNIDNVLIELDAPEPPIMDGSSLEFIKVLQQAGLQKQEANREYIVIDQNLRYVDEAKNIEMAALPLDGFRMTVMVDYNSPVLGSQHATMLDMSEFAEQFSSCRTFCFLHELEMLIKGGLIKGGDLNNAIVIVDKAVTEQELDNLAKLFQKPKISVQKQGILNNIELRFNNEPARHKLLDLVGDLALAGAPIKGQIMAARPGHAANVAFAKKIKTYAKQRKITQKYQSTETESVVFDINAIQKILPHRYPFLLVDKITKFEGNKIVGVKNVTMNEPFFQGHFPNNPIMPGVLQLEAMAQVGGILLLNNIENPQDVWVYFLAIDNARFKKPVIPGDVIVFELEMLNLRRGICKMAGRATVNGQLVSEAELVASIVPKNK